MQGLPEAFDGLDETDPAVLSAVAAVRRECTEAKEALSSDTEVSIPVLTPAAQGSVRLHRSEFEAMIRPQVEETVEALRRAIASAGLGPSQLSAVLLVGGSSRIPLVGQLVSEQLGRPVAVDADPKNAIAMGAVLSLTPTTTAGDPQVPAPRFADSARFPINAAAPPMSGPGGSPFGTGQHGAAPSASGTYRPGTGAYSAHAGAGTPPAPRTSTSGPTGARAAGAPPPARPPRSFPERPDVDDGPDFEYAPAPDRHSGSRSGRSPAWLVSVGGTAAAVAVIAAAFLWPSASPEPVDVGTQVPPSPTQEATPSPTPVEEAPPTEPDEPTRDRPEPTPEPTRPPETTAPPPPATTPPPVTTTQPPPATTTTSRPSRRRPTTRPPRPPPSHNNPPTTTAEPAAPPARPSRSSPV